MTTIKLFGVTMGTNKKEKEIMKMEDKKKFGVTMGTNKTEKQIMKMEDKKKKKKRTMTIEQEERQETDRPKRRKSKIKKTRTASPSLPPAPLPPPMMQTLNEMEGTDRIYIIRKILEWSDTAAAENRFFFPKSEVLWWQVLTEEERMAVQRGGAVDITVVDPRGRKYGMKLRRWESVKKIVINSNWRIFVDGYGLKAEVDTVEVWSFRSGPNLCFAFNVKRELPSNSSD